MDDASFFNYKNTIAESRGERNQFASIWWRWFAGDPRWVPPEYALFRRALEPGASPYLDRMALRGIYASAMPRLARMEPFAASYGLRSGVIGGLNTDRSVSATLTLGDTRRPDTAYLAWPHCVNDLASLERLLDLVSEDLAGRGFRRIIGPTGLSPHLGSGCLLDGWDRLPPLYTPYAPPYLPEMLDGLLEPLENGRLFELEIQSGQAAEPERSPCMLVAGLDILPLEPSRLAGDLLRLFAPCCASWQSFAPPEADEAAFLLSWTGRWPSQAWLAQVRGQPVGFVLVQPDLASHLKRARGGRSLFWRTWLTRTARLHVRQGRLLFGGVLPAWRGRGIGSVLLQQAEQAAAKQGWERLISGPFAVGSSAAVFLERRGGQARQHYRLYQAEI
ncbi:MAG TPA: GNAT family N-acetyltransferase [Anaerolineales bacterium]